MLDRLFQILAANWLIDKKSFESHLLAITSILQGIEIKLESEEKNPYYVSYNSDGTRQPIAIVDQWSLDDESIQENSVAVIPIQDSMFAWRTMRLYNMIKTAEANSQISSILFLISSPGGMVSQMDVTADLIKGLSKPTVAAIFEMATSAIMWLTSAMNYRIATSPIDIIGGIGVMTTIEDYSEYFKKLGIDIHEIYADKATGKNGEMRAYLKDKNEEPFKQKLNFINDYFHGYIQKNLGLKPESIVFDGGTFFAEEAKSLGLINEINSIDYALDYVYQLGIKNKISTFSKTLIK